MARATLGHQMHDLGLAAWFGGTLANAVTLNPAASSAGGAANVGEVTNAGWDRWTPINAAAIATHLIGAVGLVKHDLGRMKAQQGVPTMAVVKTALTVVALGVTGYSRLLGRKVSEHKAVPVADATTPTTSTPPEVAAAQKQLKALQWVVPATTGALVAIGAYASEQYRPEEVTKGALRRVLT
jgi:SLT domain-containing protein